MSKLQQYDDVGTILDKTKSWINFKTKKLFSREIKFKPFVAIRKRYNTEISDYEYFLIMCDNKPEIGSSIRCEYDDFGRVKFSICSIWKEIITSLSIKDSNDFNINIEYLESDEDSDTYKILI